MIGPASVSSGDPVLAPMGKGGGPGGDELGVRLDAVAVALERLVAGVDRLGRCIDATTVELIALRDWSGVVAPMGKGDRDG